MDKAIEKLNKLSLPAVILMASIILGGFYYTSQLNKQRSIEKQQQVKIEQEKQERLAKELKEQEAKEQAETRVQLNSQLLEICLSEADSSLENSFIALCRDDKRISGGDETTCSAGAIDNKISYMTASNLYDSLFKRILDKREGDKDECFKKYPQK